VLEADNEAFKNQIKKLMGVLNSTQLAMVEKKSPFGIIKIQAQKGMTIQ